MGIFVRSQFAYTGGHDTSGLFGLSPYLVQLCAIPTLLLVGCIIAAVIGKLTNKALFGSFMIGMTITVAGFFLGAGSGVAYMSMSGGGTGGSHASHASEAQPLMLHAMTASEDENHDHGGHDHADDHSHDHADGESHDHHDGEHHGDAHAMDHGPDPSKFDQDIGTFFSIYYCMTGLHAIHIIGGIIALAWLYWRSLAAHWRPDYFGPVDFVGLYWHLVDLIWIYLFPLLYLID